MSKNRKFTNLPTTLVVMTDTFINDKGDEINYVKAHLEINGLKFFLDLKADYNLRKTILNQLKDHE